VAALAGYALLTVVMTWPLARHVTTAIPGDAFDGWQNYWNLWWLKLALVDRVQNPYVTDILYAPTGVGLYFHTLNPFNGLLTLPVQLTAGLYAAYNTVVLASWVLPGYGIFLLTRWVLRRARLTPAARWLGPWLAGVVFTFAPVHMAHLLGHMQVMALEWLPFYALALLRAVERSRDGRPWLRDAGLAGLFLVLAGLCDWYFALYLFLFTALVIVWAWLTPNGRGVALPPWRRLAAPVAPAFVAGVVFALVLAPVLWPMISEATRLTYMVRPSGDLYIYSASLLDFLIPNRLHTLWRETSATWPGNQIAPLSERTIAVGYAALALAAVAVTRLRRGTGLWLAAAVVFLLVALGPRPHAGNITWESIPTAMAAGGEWSPYALLNRLVPFMRISRSVSRFAILVQMAVAVLAGMVLAYLVNRRTRLAAAVLAAGSLAVMLAEYWVAPYPVSPPDTPAIYTEIGQQPGTGSMLNLPMNYDRPGYLLYQTVHRKPLTVAYISRDDPRTLVERVPVLQHWRHLGPDIVADEPARVGRTVLADLGVEWLVLDRYKMPGGDEREITTALAAAVVTDQAPWYEDDRVTVYHLGAPATAEPYLMLGPTGWGLWQRDSDPPFRAVGPEGAEVSLRHAPAAAVVRVTYRGAGSVTPGGAPVTLAQADAPTTVDVPVAGERLLFFPEGKLEIVRLELLR
jgi:hypothetical protein